MHNAAISILLLGPLLAPGLAGSARAESDSVDLQSRAGVSLGVNLPGRWRTALEYENRRFENLATFRGHYVTAEGGYRLARGLETFANYRLARGSDWTSHRFGLGLEYELKTHGFTFGLRPMVQYRTKAVDDDDSGAEGNTFLRTRLQVQYGLTRRLDLYASVEPYFVFGTDFPVDNWKDTLGLKFEIAKHAKVDLYHIYRPDSGKSSYNRLFHVIGLELRFKAKLPSR